MKKRARDSQWRNCYDLNKSNVELRDHRKDKITQLDKYEEKATLYHDFQLKSRLDYRDHLRKKEEENTAAMNRSNANFRKEKTDNLEFQNKHEAVMSIEHPDPF